MDEKELRLIAETEARRALEVSDQIAIACERRGGDTGWDEAVCQRVAEFRFRVWETVAVVDVELDPVTGQILAWHDAHDSHKSP